MNKIVLQAIPEAPGGADKGAHKAIWVAPETKQKIEELSQASGVSLYRLTDYIVNMGLKMVELQQPTEE